MPLRLVEISMDRERVRQVVERLAGLGAESGSENGARVDIQVPAEGRAVVRVVLQSGETEAALDAIQAILPPGSGFRINLYPLEATVPRLEEADEDPQGEADSSKTREAMSREELYHDVLDMASLRPSYSVMTALAAVVAAVGLIQGNVAVLVGSMVIAPFLGPNMGLILGTALGDGPLLRSSAKTLGAGLGLAFLLSAVLGVFIHPDPSAPEIASRTVLGLSDVALALASGTAGVLSLTIGGGSLVGVMVALSLLPPLAASGLLLGAGIFLPALLAALLCLTNVICLNLAGVLTLAVQGVRPMKWWEKERARRSIRVAVALWAGLLALLVAAIVAGRLL